MFWLRAIVAFLAGSLCVFAHEDPQGDVHPSITVEDGNFVVWFYNNSSSWPRIPASILGADERPGSFKTIISPKGKILSARQPVAERTPGLFEMQGRLMTPDLLDSRSLPGVPPIWDEPPDDYGGILKFDERWIFHFTEPKSKGGTRFFFADYHPERRELRSSALIGMPARIYNFAHASNLVAVGANIYVAWIEERPPKLVKMRLAEGGYEAVEKRDTQLVLSRWKPGAASVFHLPIRQVESGNIHLALAAIGDHLLIAWHEGVAERFSKIGTEIIALESVKFGPKLPYSSKPYFRKPDEAAIVKKLKAIYR